MAITIDIYIDDYSIDKSSLKFSIPNGLEPITGSFNAFTSSYPYNHKGGTLYYGSMEIPIVTTQINAVRVKNGYQLSCNFQEAIGDILMQEVNITVSGNISNVMDTISQYLVGFEYVLFVNNTNSSIPSSEPVTLSGQLSQVLNQICQMFGFSIRRWYL